MVKLTGSRLSGSIGRPVAGVIVIHRRRRLPQLFYVDSGADIYPHSKVRRGPPKIREITTKESLSH